MIKSYLQQQKRLVVVAPVGSHEKLFDQFSDEIALGRLHVYFFYKCFLYRFALIEGSSFKTALRELKEIRNQQINIASVTPFGWYFYLISINLGFIFNACLLIVKTSITNPLHVLSFFYCKIFFKDVDRNRLLHGNMSLSKVIEGYFQRRLNFLPLSMWPLIFRTFNGNDRSYIEAVSDKLEKMNFIFEHGLIMYLDQLFASSQNTRTERESDLSWSGLSFVPPSKDVETQGAVLGGMTKIISRGGSSALVPSGYRVWPEIVFLNTSNYQQQRGEKLRILLVGHLSKRKNLSLFLETATLSERLYGRKYAFEIMGEAVDIDVSGHKIISKTKCIEAEMGHISSETKLNDAIRRSDLVWLLYNDHKGPSNIQYKAAYMNKGCLVAPGTVLEKIGRRFRNNVNVSKGSPEKVLETIVSYRPGKSRFQNFGIKSQQKRIVQ